MRTSSQDYERLSGVGAIELYHTLEYTSISLGLGKFIVGAATYQPVFGIKAMVLGLTQTVQKASRSKNEPV